MRTKSFPHRPSRFAHEASQSLPERDGSGEVVPDANGERDVPQKKCHDGETSDTVKGGSNACIICGGSDMTVMRCAGLDCPIWFHEECLTTEYGGNEDLSNPFCPYCWYKILLKKSESLKEKAIEAEKAVSVYLNKELKTSDEVIASVSQRQEGTALSGGQELEREKATDSSKVEQEKDRGKSEVGSGKARDVEEDKIVENAKALEGEERVPTQNIQEETAEVQTKVGTCAEDKGDVSLLLSLQESSSEEEDDQDQHNQKKKRRRVIKGETRDMEEDKMVEDAEASDEEKTEKLVDDERVEDQTKVNTGAGQKGHNQAQHNEKPRRRRLLKLSDIEDEVSSSKERNEDVTEEITSSSSRKTNNQQREPNGGTKQPAMTKPVRTLPSWDASFFDKNSRKRILWTYAEEEMLKSGVEKFAQEANKNMPWRKILEMGAKVFHESRTPSDLKDKWRNMLRAEAQP